VPSRSDWLARLRGAAIGEIDDHALPASVDRGMRRIDEAGDPLGQPVIAPRLAAIVVHPLLHHHPFAVVGDDEAMEIEIEAVLHGGAVDLGDQPAARPSAPPSSPTRSPTSASSPGVLRECLPRPPQTWMPSSPDSGASPRLSAPKTLVVMPDECQSIPITAPKDWNQKGCARRRNNSSRPY
jgi:hypothetical protein